MMIANSNILEARAWVRKYFRAASDDFKLFISFIKGINANKLISRPIHILNQLFEDMVMVVPTIMEVVNKIL